mmetsp:Transcript_22602/g.73133  ORF Transcript_22602/g.73133 Transcript_22602/m.73133 type:complete len:278 (-) Transcript_22602:842-1675(-)
MARDIAGAERRARLLLSPALECMQQIRGADNNRQPSPLQGCPDLLPKCGPRNIRVQPTLTSGDASIPTTETNVRARQSAEMESHAEGIVVAAVLACTLAEVHPLCAFATIAVDVINATHGRPGVHVIQSLVELLDPGRGALGVEVAHEDDAVALVGVLGDDPHDVMCRGGAGAAAVFAHGQGAVVVDEEHDLARLEVLQADPHCGPLAVPLVPAVLADILGVVGNLLPSGLPVGHAHGMRPGHSLKLAVQTRVAENPVDVLALLEAHEVERLPSMCR